MKRLAAAAALAALAVLAAFALFMKGQRESAAPVPALPMPDAPRRSAPDAFPSRARPADAPRTETAPQDTAPSKPGSSPRASLEGSSDKVRLLEEILNGRDDNDPRLDSSFNSLPSAVRLRFQQKYRSLPPESLNQRGIIVYLLGKNIADASDWAFLREVAAEPPCLSLADCSKAASGDGSAGDAVTLAYPSLVALKQAERLLSSSRAEALGVVRAGKASRVPAVVDAASRIAP